MRHVIITLMAALFFVGTAGAQDDLAGLTGKKALKKATRLLNAYVLDQQTAGDKLVEAKTVIDYAIKQEDIKQEAKAYVTMGEIYNSFVGYNQTQRVLDPEHQDVEPNGGIIASQAFKRGLELDAGNKACLNGLRQSISSITNTGLTAYENGQFSSAFSAFSSVLQIHDILKENESESPLDVEAEYDNQVYVTGMAALSAGENETALSYMKKLYDKQYDKPAVYDAMYKLTADEDIESAQKILDKARADYPDDVGLLFTEINHYLKLEKIDVLAEKLKDAIAKEPDNHSLHSTLGSVHDRLYQESFADSNYTVAQEHFDQAKKHYEDAVAIKPDYTDALYSIGALYYNKAALVTEEMNALAADYSKAGTEKYNQKKEQIEELFATALPYFKKVERLDPSDRNTLIALKEIFARKNDFEVSNEFKERLSKIEAGEKISESYFQ